MIMKTVAKPKASDFDRQLGANIRRERTLRGLSQQDLARAIGVTYQQAHKYETGANRISAARLQAIAQWLDLPLDVLAPSHVSGTQGAPGWDRLGLEMARNFARIGDPAKRQAISQLVRALVDDGEMSDAVMEASWSMPCTQQPAN
jgi:transcriptional regulator with XRE-family HTH domain